MRKLGTPAALLLLSALVLATPLNLTQFFDANGAGPIHDVHSLRRAARHLRDVHDRLLGELEYPMLLQGTAPKNAVLEEFHITPNAVSPSVR